MVSGKGARQKGLSFERKVASALRIIWPEARRHLENHEDDAAFGADLMNTGNYRFQLKKLKKYAPITAIEEVEIFEGQVPVLVTAGDFMEPMAVIPFDELLRLLKIKFNVD